MLEKGVYGDLGSAEIATAREQIQATIQQDEQTREQLEQSIETLEAAFAALGFETQ